MCSQMIVAFAAIVFLTVDLEGDALSAKAFEQFVDAAGIDPEMEAEKATNLCRLEYTEAVKGYSFTQDRVNSYKGPGALLLKIRCNGYLQGVLDILKNTPTK
nr:hypothetical protein [uncultured organism]